MGKSKDWHWVTIGGKKHYVMKGSESLLSSCPDAKQKIRERKATAIAMSTTGSSIKEIADELGISIKTLYYYMMVDGIFRQDMITARTIRGMVYEDKAIEAAEKADEQTVQSDRLKVDTYKWAAKVNNPDLYGDKVKSSVDVNVAGFIVDTGIKRDSQGRFVEKEEQPVIDVQSEAVEDNG